MLCRYKTIFFRVATAKGWSFLERYEYIFYLTLISTRYLLVLTVTRMVVAANVLMTVKAFDLDNSFIVYKVQTFCQTKNLYSYG